jgi:hypothetical protein
MPGHPRAGHARLGAGLQDRLSNLFRLSSRSDGGREPIATIGGAESTMTRLILTTSDSGAGALKQAGIAEIVIPFGLRLTLGPLPSAAELANSLAARSPGQGPTVPHWLDFLDRRRRGEIGRKGLGLVELCERCEVVELWIDSAPNAQLKLAQLLDYIGSHGRVTSKLMLVQANVAIGNMLPEGLSKWRRAAVEVLKDHFEAASMAWQAYRQSTPRAWFDLLDKDLSVLPQLGQTVLELLEELPMHATGLGATEMRMLELISAGAAHPSDLFPGYRKRNKRRVFDYWEVGSLLDGLARCPAPAVSGLDEGPFTLEMHDDRDRHERYERSKLSLTALGQAVLVQTEDFSRHNPIHRWWGGTELTNERLWRWDPVKQALIAP